MLTYLVSQFLKNCLCVLINGESNFVFFPTTACRGMFRDFAESFKCGLSQHELFEPLSRYEQICTDNVMLLKNLAKRSVPSHSRWLSASPLFLKNSSNIHSFCFPSLFSMVFTALITHHQSAQLSLREA